MFEKIKERNRREEKRRRVPIYTFVPKESTKENKRKIGNQ